MIKVLYFASLRAGLNRAEEQIALPDGVTTAGEFFEHLCALDDAHKSVLMGQKSIRMAVNQDYARDDTPLENGDEFALFPPVTGG